MSYSDELRREINRRHAATGLKPVSVMLDPEVFVLIREQMIKDYGDEDAALGEVTYFLFCGVDVFMGIAGWAPKSMTLN